MADKFTRATSHPTVPKRGLHNAPQVRELVPGSSLAAVNPYSYRSQLRRDPRIVIWRAFELLSCIDDAAQTAVGS
jgi:hypothetical protein